MQPDTVRAEQAREILTQHYGRPVEEVDTQELEELYNQLYEELNQTPYRGEQEPLLIALNLELSSRKAE